LIGVVVSFFLDVFSLGIWLFLFLFAVLLTWLGFTQGSMQKKFVKLGTVRGLTAQQITIAVGKGPSAIQHLQDGSIRTWAAIGYQITLLFDEKEVCLGVSNESGF
jgi:hypothetical protein